MVNECGVPRIATWSEESLEEELDRYEKTLSDRMNKAVRLKTSFRETVLEAYMLDEAATARRAERLEAQDRERVACPACAEAVREAEDRRLAHDIDPSLATRAYPVRLAEDEDHATVLERASDRPADPVADAAPAPAGIDADDYARLCEEDRMDGLMYRETGCEEHGRYAIAMVAEGEARMEDGVLRPRLMPE